MFLPESLEFLAENHFRGSKAWFGEHKEEYRKYVLDPLVELSNDLAPAVEKIDSQLITAAKSSVSRIYRDMRFSKSGSPYRDMMWISFRRDKQSFPCWPEFYVVVSPQEFFYGCGHYCAKSETMTELRKLVASGHKTFENARQILQNKKDLVLEGDVYKKSRYPDYSEVLRNWLDRKTVCFSYHPEMEELFSCNLAEKISKAFIEMKPLYDLLILAEEKAINNI